MPSTAMRSASAPGATTPSLPSMRSTCAAIEVALWIASCGVSTCARITRAVLGHDVMPMTKITV